MNDENVHESLEFRSIHPSAHLAPDPNKTITLPAGSFKNARGFQMDGMEFYDLSGRSGFDTLWESVIPDAYHDGFSPTPRVRCHPGTREPILRSISNWFQDSSGSHPIMWVHGAAGAGKTTIAQTVAETFNKSGKLAASFFFLRGDSDSSGVQGLIPTLAWKIARTIPGIAQYIDYWLREDASIPSKSIDIQFEHLISKPIKELARSSVTLGTFLVIIDAIDECKDKQAQRHFLQLIRNLANHSPLRFLVCSRPEDHIREALGHNLMRRIDLESQAEVEDDIRRYLSDELSRIRSERIQEMSTSEPWTSENVIDTLVSKSSGRFIYASTIVKFVDDKDFDPQKQLDIILRLRVNDASKSALASLDQLQAEVRSQQRYHTPLNRFLGVFSSLRPTT